MEGVRVKQIQQFIVGTIGIAYIDEQGDFSTAQGTEVWNIRMIQEHVWRKNFEVFCNIPGTATEERKE